MEEMESLFVGESVNQYDHFRKEHSLLSEKKAN